MSFMKPILGFLIICIVVMSDNSEDSDELAEDQRMPDREFVIQINNRRRAFAKEHNVANMHELSWRKEISDATPVWAETRLLNQVFAFTYKKAIDHIDSTISEISRDIQKGSMTRNFYLSDPMELLAAAHNMIGCKLTKVPRYGDNVFMTFCYLQPEAFVGYPDVRGMEALPILLGKYGEPGSKCPDGYGNNDGLCSLVGSFTPKVVMPDEKTTEKPKMSDQEFVIQINNRRRAFAKEHKLANMHELSWSKELSDEAPEGRENPDTLEKKRYFPVNYEHGLFNIDYIIPLISDHVVNGTKIIYYDKGAMIVLTPTHNVIGCGHIPWNKAIVTFCYLSPGTLVGLEGKDMLKEILSVKGEPGSKCPDGYGNNDGLCSLIGTFTPKIEITTEEVITIQEPETSSEIPITEARPTEAPPTEALSTEAPLTEAPLTEAPPTEAPSTEAPPTEAPPTEAPSAQLPSKKPEDKEVKESDELEDFTVSDSELQSDSSSSVIPSLTTIVLSFLLVIF